MMDSFLFIPFVCLVRLYMLILYVVGLFENLANLRYEQILACHYLKYNNRGGS